MLYVVVAVALVPLLLFTWQLSAGDRYESANYKVVERDDKFEIREYPELIVAATSMNSRGKGDNGSFMRLFRYISGENDSKQKIAMTTPVFMEGETEVSDGQMAFVLPADVAARAVPSPTNEAVEVEKRPAGQYAVVRFSGRMDSASVKQAETQLRSWIKGKNLTPMPQFEFAGYDPPWTPGPLRRNEVLIRLAE
jgi:DNA gyrase inhibitor GyrI